MSYEQSVSLLRQNKRAMAASVADCGFNGVDASTRASLFPTYLKWAGGLLDITLATRYKGEGENKGQAYYFTVEEWKLMDSATQKQYAQRGLRLRAKGKCLIIALAETSLKWGTATAMLGASVMSGSSYFRFDDSRKETETMYGFYKTEGTDYAADYAMKFRAFSEASAGLEDVTKWSVPALSHLWLMYEYRNQINEVLNALEKDPLSTTGSYWSCCQYDTSNAWYETFGLGLPGWNGKTSTLIVRPVAVE